MAVIEKHRTAERLRKRRMEHVKQVKGHKAEKDKQSNKQNIHASLASVLRTLLSLMPIFSPWTSSSSYIRLFRSCQTQLIHNTSIKSKEIEQ